MDRWIDGWLDAMGKSKGSTVAARILSGEKCQNCSQMFFRLQLPNNDRETSY